MPNLSPAKMHLTLNGLQNPEPSPRGRRAPARPPHSDSMQRVVDSVMGAPLVTTLTTIVDEARPVSLRPSVGHDVQMPRVPLFERSQSAADATTAVSLASRPRPRRSRSSFEDNSRFIKVRGADHSLLVLPKAPLPEAVFALPASPQQRLALAERVTAMLLERVADGLQHAYRAQIPDQIASLGVTAETLATLVTALLSDEGYFDRLTQSLAQDCSEATLMHRQSLRHTRLDTAERHLNRLCTTVRHRSERTWARSGSVSQAAVAEVCARLGVFAGLAPDEIRPRTSYVAAHLSAHDLACLQTYLTTPEGTAWAAFLSQSAPGRAAFLRSEHFQSRMREMLGALQRPAGHA